MDKVARKIAPAKWASRSYLPPEAVGADALTGCLRTQTDALSFWACNNDDSSLKDVVLALACRFERPEKMHLVVLEMKTLLDSGLEIEETEGGTVVNDLRGRHRDVVHLSMEALCIIARLIAQEVRAAEGHHVFSKAEVLDILRTAVEHGRLSLDTLGEKVREGLEKT